MTENQTLSAASTTPVRPPASAPLSAHEEDLVPMPVEVILNELDQHEVEWERAQRAPGTAPCRRARTRRRFRIDCEICYFEGQGIAVRKSPGKTRNISERGIGLLAKPEVRAGVPIEVRITPPGRPPVYVAGIVMYCRYALRGFHTIGVELRARQAAPVFSHDSIQAVRYVPWIQEALSALARAWKHDPVAKPNGPEAAESGQPTRASSPDPTPAAIDRAAPTASPDQPEAGRQPLAVGAS